MGRPVPAEEAKAFEVWVGDANRNVAQVARITGISENVLYDWKIRYNWADRWSKALAASVSPAREKATAEVVAGLSAAALRLVKIVSNPKSSDRDAINAASLLFRYGLVDPTAQAGPGSARPNLTLVDARSIVSGSDVANGLRSDLIEASSRIIEGNVELAETSARQARRTG